MGATIFICGDSTAASYGPEQAPLTGWGQVLPELLPGATIVNRAIAGRSTRTFLNEGRLDAIGTLIRPGDALLIQFGHNDGGNKPERHTEPWGDFTDNLNRFVDFALEHGARPVLLTPICIRLWRDGALQPSHGEYLEAVRALAAKRGLPLIDLYEASRAVVSGLGERGSRALYMHLAPGEFPGWPEGSVDDTHTRRAGAEAFARAVADALPGLGIIEGA